MSRISRRKQILRDCGSAPTAKCPEAGSLWRTLTAFVPGNRLALRFFATFGILAAVYFTSTMDLKLKDPGLAREQRFAAALASANHWIRGTLLEPYQRGIAAASAALLGFIGQEADAQGREIRSPAFAVAITSGCDAIEPSLLLCVAILSFPAGWREKVAGIIVGAAAIATLNIVRVVTLWLVGLHWRGAFDVIHFTIWPFLLIVLTLFIFIHWLHHVGRARVQPTTMLHAA